MSKRTFSSRSFMANTFASAAWTGMVTSTTLIDMHIFRYPDGVINSEDGYVWMYPPFGAAVTVEGIFSYVAASQIFTPGAEAEQLFTPGAEAEQLQV